MLKIRNLEKSYGSFKVLNGLNMTVNRGDIYGFLGKNGCGKTTTMNIVANVIPKDSGEVTFENEKVKIGYLPESPALFEYMNAREYLEYISACCKFEGDAQKRISEVLEITGMSNAGSRRIKGYSRGMNQRLGIASAIFDNPDLLILDEPTSALDPQGRAEVMSIITRLSEMGTTIILCTHILSDVDKVANRIGILRNGNIAVEGTINEVKEQFSGGKSIKLTVFGNPDDAISFISDFSVGKFNYNKNSGEFTIPLGDKDNEKTVTARLIQELTANNIIPSSLNTSGKTVEEIYLDTIR